MESSKRFLLLAEIEFWREMLHLNKDTLSFSVAEEMRFHMKKAEQRMRKNQFSAQQIAA